MSKYADVRTPWDLINTDRTIDDWGVPVTKDDLFELRKIVSGEWYSAPNGSPLKKYLAQEIVRIDAKIAAEAWQ